MLHLALKLAVELEKREAVWSPHRGQLCIKSLAS